MQFRSVLFSLVLALSIVGVACGSDDPEQKGGSGGEVGEGGEGGTDVGEGGTGGTDVGEGGTGGTDVGEGGTGGTDVGEGGTGGSEEPVVEVGSVEILDAPGCFGTACGNISVGQIRVHPLRILDLDEQPILDAEVEWASSNAEVATVVDGVVTALAPGAASITATSGGVTATLELTSTWAPLAFVDLVEQNEGALTVNVGETITVRAHASRNGRFGPLPTIMGFPTWAVSDSTVAEIVEEFVDRDAPALTLRGLQAGTVTVTITAHPDQATDVTATANVTVR